MQGRLPSFSVIIPVHNGEATVARAIDSVLAQSYPPLEVVVVDDGSTDATADRVAAFEGLVRLIRQDNRGVSEARNRGVASARGMWLAFLDADDWYYPERLRAHAEWIADDPRLDFLTGDFDYVRPDGSIIGRSMRATRAGEALLTIAQGGERVVMEGATLGSFVAKHFGDTHTVSLSREAFAALGGYPAGIAVCEDIHLLIRLTARSRRVGVTCRPLGAYVIHESSATRSNPLRAQSQTVAALVSLRAKLRKGPAPIRRGLEDAIRDARLDLAYALLRQRPRYKAFGAIAPLLLRPEPRALYGVASVIRGIVQGP
jgi:GT2 family glycosyltransferase